MRVFIFGTGRRYQRYKDEIVDADTIVALLDNDKSKQGTIIDGHAVYSPNILSTNNEYDILLVMSVFSDEIRSQLLSLGVSSENIWTIDKYIGFQKRGQLLKYFSNPVINSEGKKVLLITVEMSMAGGTLALIYAAFSLLNLGYNVEIATYSINEELLQTVTGWGIIVNVYPNLFWCDLGELFWTDDFEVIIVNTYQMMRCASELARKRNVFWWLHETRPFYTRFKPLFHDIDIDNRDRLRIIAVSPVARDNFLDFYDFDVDILGLGIPDEKTNDHSFNQRMILAVVGGISERKGQDIMVNAIALMTKELREEVECWFIGPCFEDDFTKRVQSTSEDYSNIKFIGPADREDMKRYYRSIDVVVVPSREETMSIAAIEGMMNGLLCIVSDSTGISEFIEEKENGMIFSSENAKALCNSLSWAATHRKDICDIGNRGRHTYEENFTLERLGDNWIKIIEKYN